MSKVPMLYANMLHNAQMIIRSKKLILHPESVMFFAGIKEILPLELNLDNTERMK